MALADEAKGVELPLVSNDVEAAPESRSEVSRKVKERRVEYVALAALMWSLFMEGWNDATTGPLIPVMQSHYKISYTVVSLVFVTNGVGFVVSAILNIYLSHRIGFGKTLVLGAIMQIIAYSLQSSAPPFPVFAIAYVFSGFGVAIQNAQSVDFCVSVRSHSATKMGFVQGAYGLGALSAPIAATHFAMMPRWSFQYLISLGGAIINVIFLSLAFKLQHLEDVLVRAGQPVREQSQSQDSHYLQLFKLKSLYFIAFFSFVYVGAEITLAGWIVTFVLVDRGGGISSGYLSSGFFAGLFLGRVGLLLLNKAVGERRVVYLYILLCIGLEITIWVIPSFIGNAISVSFIGFFMGPIFPILMNLIGRIIPRWLISGAVGLTTGLGQTGSAVIPFVAGAMASKFGIGTLHPLLVGVLTLLIGVWAPIPSDPPEKVDPE